MNFKEALIAHFDHQDVRVTDCYGVEHKFFDYFRLTQLQAMHVVDSSTLKFRIEPRTIRVNGVEVPAPERAAPEEGTEYYVSTVERENTYYLEATWDEHCLDRFWLNRGLVYLNKEDAIARAKAMLLTQE